MMKKTFKTFITLTTVATMLLSQPVFAKSTDYKKAMSEYKKALSSDKFFNISNGDFTPTRFILVDIDQDGVPELLGDAFTHTEKEDEDQFCLQLLSYKDGKTSWDYNSYTRDIINVNAKTHTFTIENDWKGHYICAIYKVTKKGVKLIYSYEKEKGKFTIYDEKKKKYVAVSKKTIEKNTAQYLKGNKKLTIKDTYENTKSNRDKYMK